MVKVKRLGYRVTDDAGRIFELVEKKGTVTGEDATEELINKFFDKLDFTKFPLVNQKQKSEFEISKKEESKKEVAIELNKAAGIPFPSERQMRIISELTEFTISDIGELFATKPDINDRVYDRRKIIDNAYHDIKDLLEYNKIELIPNSTPKKYRVIDRSPDGLRQQSIKSLIGHKRMDLATHKEIPPI